MGTSTSTTSRNTNMPTATMTGTTPIPTLRCQWASTATCIGTSRHGMPTRTCPTNITHIGIERRPAGASRQFFDAQPGELHPRAGVVVLQADEALGRSGRVLELTDLLAVESNRDR